MPVSAQEPRGKPALVAVKKTRRGTDPTAQKRRCVSTACVACRKRKSKCDGVLPSCAACASVYCTECVYDPNSDHRRKGVLYREKGASVKSQNSTLRILIQAILNAAEEAVPEIVRRIRTCDSLDAVAEALSKEDLGNRDNGGDDDDDGNDNDDDEQLTEYSAARTTSEPVDGRIELARKMAELRLENGLVRFIGGTSHLIYMGDSMNENDEVGNDASSSQYDTYHGQSESKFELPYLTVEEAVNSWTDVTDDTSLIIHLINRYFNWHYTYFTILSKSMFYRDFLRGRPHVPPSRTVYCTPLLVNAMLALGCHFTSVPKAYAVAGDSRTKGNHFFTKAKQLIIDNDEFDKPKLATVQALALMSLREFGCAREANGWVYSGISFRMAQDIGLAFEAGRASPGNHQMHESEIDARRITFWGCFLFDKVWSNYLGRLPQLPNNSHSVPKYDVFPNEDAEAWSPLTDAGYNVSLPPPQPSRTRAAGLQLSRLCEISSDLLLFFYHPNHIGRSSGKAAEVKKFNELHRRLKDWRSELPKEFEPKDGQLPNVILMHMFFHLQYIHLFRPFLKYSPATSPLPRHVSPRRICAANASTISNLTRLYKKSYSLRQICNTAVYMIHSACTVHLLNLPEKTARRDFVHDVRHLEEIAEDWPCARRTLWIIAVLARKWNVDVPEEADVVLQRCDKGGSFNTADVRPTSLNVNTGFGTTSMLTTDSEMPMPMLPPASQVSSSSSASTQSMVKVKPYGHAFDPAAPPVPHLPRYLGDPTMPSMLSGLFDNLPVTASFPDYMTGLSSIPQAMRSADQAAAMTGDDVMFVGNEWPHASNLVNYSHHPHAQLQSSLQYPQPASAADAEQPGSSKLSPDEEKWLLRERASWQHKFQAWEMDRYLSPSTTLPHQLQSHARTQGMPQQLMMQDSGSPTSSGNPGTPRSDSNLYMLRIAMQGSDHDLLLDGVDESAAGLDSID